MRRRVAKSVGRNAVYNLIGSALPLALSLATVPVYLKLVGPDRYSVLAIAWLFLGYFGLFDLGLGRATAYRIAAQKDAPAEDRAITFWTATLINPMIGVITGGILWGVSAWYFSSVFKVDAALRPEILASVPLLALSVPIATLTGTLTGTLQGREQFLKINMISVTSTALFQILPLSIAWFHGPYLPLLLGSATLARLIAVAWLWWECHKEVGRGFRPRISRERFKDLIGYGGWVAISSLIGPLLVVSDRFVIGGVLGALAVTHYTVPFQLVQRIQIVPTAITQALMPRMSGSDAAARERLGDMADRILEALLTPGLLVAILIFEPAMRLWVGSALGGEMAPAGRVMIVAFWLFALSAVKITLLYSSGRPRAVTTAYAIEIPLYFAVLYAAMNGFALMGCAYALMFRCGMDLVVQGWLFEKKLPGLRTTANFVLLLAGTYVAALWLVTPKIGLPLASVLIVASAILALRGLPPEARQMALDILRRKKAAA
jgi:O-antigen/teichoic acid export membrane protein